MCPIPISLRNEDSIVSCSAFLHGTWRCLRCLVAKWVRSALLIFRVFKDGWFCVWGLCFGVRLAESQWERSIYSLMLHSCSACHARENSNKVILSEDFKFSNAKCVRDYRCTYAEIKDAFQVALSALFLPVLSLFCFTYWQLLLYNLCYYWDFRLYCCLLSFWQQVTCHNRKHLFHSMRLNGPSLLSPVLARETILVFCNYGAKHSILIVWVIWTKVQNHVR